MNKKATRAELNNAIVRYGTINPEKIAIAKEVKELGEEIKDYFEELGITKFDALGYSAVVMEKHGKKLNLDKVLKLIGKEKLESCYEPTITYALTVTATAAAAVKGNGIKAA